jgi:uncharacterized sodium:solute symporter family permease YidK
VTFSAELKRFLADHATAESRAAFSSSIGAHATVATLAAAMNAKGYQVGEAEVSAALDFSKQVGLSDQQLAAVVGGQDMNVGNLMNSSSTATDAARDKLSAMGGSKDAVSIGDMFEMQMLMNHFSQLSDMSSNVLSASNNAIASMARNIKG